MSERIGNWNQTYSGIAIYPLDPRPEEITIEDIAHHLSLICRYGGACKFHYSVAQHSILVSSQFDEQKDPTLALWGLLHDASEAYIGDMVRPLKAVTSFAEGFLAAERKLMLCIAEKFGLPTTGVCLQSSTPDMNGCHHLGCPIEPPEIIEADRRMLVTEKHYLMAPPPQEWSHAQGNGAQPYRGITFHELKAVDVERTFLTQFQWLQHLRSKQIINEMAQQKVEPEK